MVGSTEPFTDGYDITAAGQNAAHDARMKQIASNAFGLIYIEADQTIANQKNQDMTVDTFTDSDGYYNTVDTGTTTMYEDTSDDTYSNQVLDELSSEDRNSEDGTTSTTTWSVTANEGGIYVSSVKFKANANTTFTITIDQGGQVAQVTQVGTTGSTYTKTLTTGDYSSLLSAGAFTITITGGSHYLDNTGAGTTNNALVTSTDSSTFKGQFKTKQGEPQATVLKADLPTLYKTPTKVALFLDYFEDDFDEDYLSYSITSGAGTDSGISVSELFTLVNASGIPTTITISATADALQRIKGYCLMLVE